VIAKNECLQSQEEGSKEDNDSDQLRKGGKVFPETNKQKRERTNEGRVGSVFATRKESSDKTERCNKRK